MNPRNLPFTARLTALALVALVLMIAGTADARPRRERDELRYDAQSLLDKKARVRAYGKS